MLAQSGNDIYAVCLYADGLMQWTTGNHQQDGGTNGFGGTAASVGFESSRFSYYLPGSRTCSIIHIASRSNVNIPGLFVFLLEAGTEQYFGIKHVFFHSGRCKIIITVPVCKEGDIRLVPVGNVNGSGRVEMCLDREWRIVGDETWGVEEATVVCRQLGLPTDGKHCTINIL